MQDFLDRSIGEVFGAERTSFLGSTLIESTKQAYAVCEQAVKEPDEAFLAWIDSQPDAQHNPLRFFYCHGSHASAHLLMNVQDHTETLAHLFADPTAQAHVWSYTSIARVAVENACLFSELVDRKATPAKRILRYLAIVLDDAQALARIVNDLNKRQPGNDNNRELSAMAEKFMKKVCLHAENEGIELKKGNRDRITCLRWDDHSCPIKFNMTELIGRRLVHFPEAYRVGSAVVHGQRHMLLTERTNKEILAPYDIGVPINATIMCLGALHAMVRACGDQENTRYLGQLHEQMKQIATMRQL